MKIKIFISLILTLTLTGSIFKIEPAVGATRSFTDNGNGTITDNNTGLMWQKEDDNTTRTWVSAITYCEGLSLVGYTDWRLPNIKELKSIVDNTEHGPAIDTTYFPNTNSDYYWSSTTLTTYQLLLSFDVWCVIFNHGIVYYYDETSSYYVRCVCAGQ